MNCRLFILRFLLVENPVSALLRTDQWNVSFQQGEHQEESNQLYDAPTVAYQINTKLTKLLSIQLVRMTP